MKKLLTLIVLTLLFGSATGCRIGECWREAWNSRFHPQQQQQAVIVNDSSYMVTESCGTPCASSCTPAASMPTGPTPAGTRP